MELTVEERRIIDTFYLDPDFEDKSSAEEFLKLHGYDSDKGENDFRLFIATKKADLTILKGAELQKKFDKALSGKTTDAANDAPESNYALAARNFEGLTEGDRQLIQENLEALERMRSKK